MKNQPIRRHPLGGLFFILSLILLLTSCGKGEPNLPAGASTGNSPSPGASNATPPAGASAQAAQTTAAFGPKIKFKRISLDQGLSQSIVYDVLQDRYGLMWIATWDGLNRYDGYTFRVYKNNPDDATSLCHNSIRDLYEDRQGTLWIGTDQGLCQYDRPNDRFIRYQHDGTKPKSLAHNSVGRVYEDSLGQLWIGTWGGGLDLLDRDSGQFTHYKNNPADPGSLSSNTLGDVYEDLAGRLWVGTWNGLDLFDRKSGTFRHYPHDPRTATSRSNYPVRSIREDRSGRLWIGTNGGGVDVLEPLTGKFTHYQSNPDDPQTLSDNKVWMVYPDASGTIWVTTNNGLNQYQPATDQFIRYLYDVENPDDPESLSSPIIQSIYQDHSGLYWLGTSGGGLNLFSSTTNRFLHYRHDPDLKNSLSNNFVWSIFEDRQGVLWIGTTFGLNRYDRRANRFKQYIQVPGNNYSLSHSSIKSIFQDPRGVLWVGTDQGLNQYDPLYDRFKPFRLSFSANTEDLQNQAQDLGSVPVWAIASGSGETLWLGTGGQGLLKLNPRAKNLVVYAYDTNKPDSLSGMDIVSLLTESDGSLWAGTVNRGLNHYNPATGKFQRYLNNPADPNSLSDNTILSIYRDSRGVLWLGTLGGLNQFDPATQGFTYYRGKDGLPSDVVYGILEDDQGYLWLSTNAGISRFDPHTAVFRNFNYRDGLQSNEFNSGAYFRGVDGEMYFGGINGYSAFQPDQIIDDPYIPPLLLTAVTQSGDPLAVGQPEYLGEVTLQWPKNYFEFEFAALSYIQPEDNQYAYKLDGFETQWNMIGTRRDGRYTNLPGGIYTLRMKGSNNDGTWNEQGIALKVTVVPPLWENPLVQWGGVALVLLILFSGYRLRISGIQKHNEQLAAQVAERTKEIEQRRQVAEGLRDILVLLNSNRSLDESLNFIIGQVSRLTKADRVCLFQVSSGTHPRVISTPPTVLADEIPTGEKSVPQVTCPPEVLDWFTGLVKDARPRVLDNLPEIAQELPQCFEPWIGDFQTLVMLPIAPNGEVFGGLAVLFQDQKAFSQDELELLNSFADQAELAMGNALLRSKAEELAVVSERNRLARDLHDAVTQTLFSASLIAEALPALLENDRDEGLKLLGELRQLNRGALAEMRSLLMELRPSVVVDARLPDLLQQLAEAVTGRTGLAVSLDIRGACRLPNEVHVGLYRIAQEALTNVMKHARASKVSLRLVRDPADDSVAMQDKYIKINLEVSDDGCGFDADKVPPNHFGLMNIRERAQAIGATLEITTRPGKGTRVLAEWQGKALGDDR
jgi:ligand-binding sensor domain-containing protein/signal transduction histidine kinase